MTTLLFQSIGSCSSSEGVGFHIRTLGQMLRATFFFLELIKFESTMENNRYGPVFLVATVGLQLGKITPPAGTQKQITSPNTCLTLSVVQS